jgi:hypothetical protein
MLASTMPIAALTDRNSKYLRLRERGCPRQQMKLEKERAAGTCDSDR